jgi:peptidoglycan/LPS O-acetylase OafA/YrhL
MPYFFIFEMMGPLVEMQGYLMVFFLAAVFGMLNREIAGLLFVSIILMGILISVASLYLAEKESDYFTFKELGVLVFYAFIENFGLRQLISFWRVTGYANSLKKPKGWGKIGTQRFRSEEGPHRCAESVMYSN